MGIKIGICGVGTFADCFIPLFRAHPDVENVVLCDLDQEKLEGKCRQFDVTDRCGSLDELCTMDVDAIAIITQHHLHGPQAAQAIRAGKNVYSAVPSALTVDEMADLVKAVEETGRIYMVGETSYYYPCAIYCRSQFQAGAFGKVVYSEGEYYHDYSHGMLEVLQHRHGPLWKHYANWPPFNYPTHSLSMVVSVTGAYVTQVSAMGVVDSDPDGLFNGADQFYDNHFSNESMLCRMSDGSVARFNEFRRIGHPGTVRMSMHGTEASYEQQTGSQIWVTKDRDDLLDLSDLLTCQDIPVDPTDGMAKLSGSDGTHKGMSQVHPISRLPKEFVGLRNGHSGSHQFLVHDFVSACVHGETPPNNVWDAARYLVPGLIAHESARNEGVLMDVPDFGYPSTGKSSSIASSAD
ncbi:MAG: Gfo/Idh/MocA family oxidoreductase [Spirochaetales bacterium]|jgi:predicted dehydrogenase|nr:Gfo/Idh/MocA family oxidoreductase [Spirochaetales bacterium]